MREGAQSRQLSEPRELSESRKWGMTNTTAYGIPTLHEDLLSCIDMAKNGCKIVFAFDGDKLVRMWN